MEHLTLKAVTTAREQGIFTAVISTASIDREKDVVDPVGMVAALQKWTQTGKQIPLAWNHSTDADQIIGSVNPASAKDIGGEVVVGGQIDQSTDTGAHAWRLIKAGVVGFSFGYLILKGSNRKGGGRNITELDVFEITATPTPMNNDTRVLDYKGDKPDVQGGQGRFLQEKQTDAPPTPTQLRILQSMIGQAQEYIASDPDPEDAAEMADVLESLEELVGEPDTEDEGPDAPMMEQMAVEGEHKDFPQETADATDKGPKIYDELHRHRRRARSVDPLKQELKQKADALALEFASDGESLQKPPPSKPAPQPAPRFTPAEIRELERKYTLLALTGEDIDEQA